MRKVMDVTLTPRDREGLSTMARVGLDRIGMLAADWNAAEEVYGATALELLDRLTWGDMDGARVRIELPE